MKKLISIALALCLIVSAFAFGSAEGKSYKVGIVLMIENGAFMDMKSGIIAGLEKAGYVDGENLTIVYRCAYGDSGTLNQICNDMDDGTYDLVMTIATPTTQAFVNLESETPCVFCSVAAPVAAQVMSALDTPDMNATGTSNAIPAGDILSMGLLLTPDVKTFGLVYSTSEVNALNAMQNAKAFLDANGYSYVEATVTNSSEVSTATSVVLEKGAEAIFVANDATVQASVEALVELANEAGVPTYACSATTVLSGCLATLAMSDVAIGKQTAAIAAKVLSGTPVAEIPAEVVPANIVSVNKTTMEALGIVLPEEVLAMGEIMYLE